MQHQSRKKKAVLRHFGFKSGLSVSETILADSAGLFCPSWCRCHRCLVCVWWPPWQLPWHRQVSTGLWQLLLSAEPEVCRAWKQWRPSVCGGWRCHPMRPTRPPNGLGAAVNATMVKQGPCGLPTLSWQAAARHPWPSPMSTMVVPMRPQRETSSRWHATIGSAQVHKSWTATGTEPLVPPMSGAWSSRMRGGVLGRWARMVTHQTLSSAGRPTCRKLKSLKLRATLTMRQWKPWSWPVMQSVAAPPLVWPVVLSCMASLRMRFGSHPTGAAWSIVVKVRAAFQPCQRMGLLPMPSCDVHPQMKPHTPTVELWSDPWRVRPAWFALAPSLMCCPPPALRLAPATCAMLDHGGTAPGALEQTWRCAGWAESGPLSLCRQPSCFSPVRWLHPWLASIGRGHSLCLPRRPGTSHTTSSEHFGQGTWLENIPPWRSSIGTCGARQTWIWQPWALKSVRLVPSETVASPRLWPWWVLGATDQTFCGAWFISWCTINHHQCPARLLLLQKL